MHIGKSGFEIQFINVLHYSGVAFQTSGDENFVKYFNWRHTGINICFKCELNICKSHVNHSVINTNGNMVHLSEKSILV